MVVLRLARLVVTLGAASAVLSMAAPAEAQEADRGQPVRVEGVVQWIDGTKLAMTLDNARSVSVDLEQADQASYQYLQPGDRLTVVGFITPNRDRIVATSVIPAIQGR
jgi:hypothetical protein